MPVHVSESPYGVGYSEAKWVTEQMLQNASKERGLHTIVMRLGQVAGDRLGYWNEREWFPALVKSALFQKCLPDLEGVRASGLSCVIVDTIIFTDCDLVPRVRGSEGVH